MTRLRRWRRVAAAAVITLGVLALSGAVWAAVGEPGRPAAQRAARHIAVLWLLRSRAQAVQAGVRPIPPAMRRKLRRYFPAALLRSVRYRVGARPAATMQGLVLDSGRKDAITLINVIVFRTARKARNDELWAHELEHACQFRRWGVAGFVRRYMRNDWAVEWQAYETEFRYERYLKGLVKHRHGPCPLEHALPALPPAGRAAGSRGAR